MKYVYGFAGASNLLTWCEERVNEWVKQAAGNVSKERIVSESEMSALWMRKGVRKKLGPKSSSTSPQSGGKEGKERGKDTDETDTRHRERLERNESKPSARVRHISTAVTKEKMWKKDSHTPNIKTGIMHGMRHVRVQISMNCAPLTLPPSHRHSAHPLGSDWMDMRMRIRMMQMMEL
jgi:hypothetical protein